MMRLGSLAFNILYDYTKQSYDCDEESGMTQIRANHQRLNSLRTTLEKYGGIFSKVSQMLSYYDNIPKDSYDNCKPFSRDETHIWFMNYLDESDELPYTVDRNIYNSGSIGQVYKGYYKDKDIAIKVLYRGLIENTVHDLKALELLSSFSFGFVDLSNGIKEINKKMCEELDFLNEAKNTQKMYELWKDDDDIVVPHVYNSISNKDVIATEFVKGVSLYRFLNSGVTQEEKNRVGFNMVKFVFTNLYKWGILYSDSHYGNIIVTPEGKISFIDFGCIHVIDESTRVIFVRLHRAAKLGDKSLMMRYIEELGVINDKTSFESREYAVDFFMRQYTPWISNEPFKFNSKWFDTVDSKNPKLMREWVLPEGLIYFNKIPHGFTHMLCGMECEVNFRELFDEIL